MKPICFIGARSGSKGVPGKNMRLLAGKPLIAHCIETMLDSDVFSSVVVSTDSEKIAQIAKKYGADVPFMRPKKLATDSASMDEVMIHAIEKLRSLGYDFDIFVNRDCTVPFIRKKDVVGTVNSLKRNNCDAVFAVYEQHHNPYFNQVEVNARGFLQISKKLKHEIINRQDAPMVYQVNGLFTMHVDNLLKYGRSFMPRVIPYVIPPEIGLMIDTEFEFQIAEMIAQKRIKIPY